MRDVHKDIRFFSSGVLLKRSENLPLCLAHSELVARKRLTLSCELNGFKFSESEACLFWLDFVT